MAVAATIKTATATSSSTFSSNCSSGRATAAGFSNWQHHDAANSRTDLGSRSSSTTYGAAESNTARKIIERQIWMDKAELDGIPAPATESTCMDKAGLDGTSAATAAPKLHTHTPQRGKQLKQQQHPQSTHLWAISPSWQLVIGARATTQSKHHHRQQPQHRIQKHINRN